MSESPSTLKSHDAAPASFTVRPADESLATFIPLALIFQKSSVDNSIKVVAVFVDFILALFARLIPLVPVIVSAFVVTDVGKLAVLLVISPLALICSNEADTPVIIPPNKASPEPLRVKGVFAVPLAFSVPNIISLPWAWFNILKLFVLARIIWFSSVAVPSE